MGTTIAITPQAKILFQYLWMQPAEKKITKQINQTTIHESWGASVINKQISFNKQFHQTTSSCYNYNRLLQLQTVCVQNNYNKWINNSKVSLFSLKQINKQTNKHTFEVYQTHTHANKNNWQLCKKRLRKETNTSFRQTMKNGPVTSCVYFFFCLPTYKQLKFKCNELITEGNTDGRTDGVLEWANRCVNFKRIFCQKTL